MNNKAQFGLVKVGSLIACALIILVFLLLFKTCSKPTIQTAQFEVSEDLDERQEALWVLTTPVSYKGEDVSLAYVISLGSTPGEFDAIKPTLETALKDIDDATGTKYSLHIIYRQDWQQRTGTIDNLLDFVSLPTPSGETLKVGVGRARQGSHIGFTEVTA